MASTSSRRGMSNRLLETTRSDDPWCLICGVNLALDGRTFSIVSCHQNSEISDTLVNVLGMKFTEDHASVNVCNRCERQLKRLGRTTNTAQARSEGRQLREQAEKNLAKHVQTGVEVGDFRDISSSTSATSSGKPIRDGAATSTRAVKRGTSFDVNSSGKTTREHYSRSTSVRFDDEKEDQKRGAVYRDHSAPERIIQKRERELVSSWDEANKSKHVRSGTRTSVYSTSVERTSSTRTSTADQKSTLERKSSQKASVVRDKPRSIAKANFVDAAKKLGKGSPGQMSANNGENDNIKSHGESKKRDEVVDNPRALPQKIQTHDKDADFRAFSSEQTNPFIFDDQEKGEHTSFDSTGPFGYDTTVQFGEDHDHSVEDNEHFQRKEHFQDVDETAIKTDRSGAMVSSGGRESWHQINPNRENGDFHSLTAGEKDYKSQNIDDDLNSGRNEDSDFLAADEDKDRARNYKVTFSATIVSGDTRAEDQSERGTTPSGTIRNEKGKLSKYESLDLEIDKSNPFFDEVYGEYNRRVYLNSRVKNGGGSNGSKRESKKPEVIPEADDAEESDRLKMEPDWNTLAVKKGAEIRSDEVASSGLNDALKKSPLRTSLGGGSSEDLGEAQSGKAGTEIDVSGENQQDSAPLIGDSEENKEENKDGDDLQGEGTTHPGEASDDVDGTSERQSLKDVDGGQDERNEESFTGVPHQEGEDDVMVNEVIQVTHMAPPMNSDLVDAKGSEGVSFVMSSPEENESQVSLPPGQTVDARGVKTEVSPLIDKEAESSDKKEKKGNDSKFKDQQPGFACCNIL